MSKSVGVIPKLIIFIIGLWFAIPSPIDISIIIAEAFQRSFPSPLGSLLIFSLRFLGVCLAIGGFISIIVQFRRGEYF